MTKSRPRPQPQPREPGGLFGLRPVNVVLLAGGLSAVAVGYVLLSGGSIVAAPLFLFLGYAVLVPAGLLWGFRGRNGGRDRGE